MKFVLALLIGVFGSIVFGQKPYHWINLQYDPGDLAEYPIKDYFKIDGGVASITEVTEHFQQDGGSYFTRAFYNYRKDGQISSLNRIQMDGSEIHHRFNYNSEGVFQFQTANYVFNTGNYLDTLTWDTLYILHEVVIPDTLVINEKGNTVFYRSYIDEVYTNFDNSGRKLQDSIPGNGQTMEQLISYTYFKKKIIKKEVYPQGNISIETTYYIDPRGNWNKCVIKSNEKRKNAVITRELTYH